VESEAKAKAAPGARKKGRGQRVKARGARKAKVSGMLRNVRPTGGRHDRTARGSNLLILIRIYSASVT